MISCEKMKKVCNIKDNKEHKEQDKIVGRHSNKNELNKIDIIIKINNNIIIKIRIIISNNIIIKIHNMMIIWKNILELNMTYKVKNMV